MPVRFINTHLTPYHSAIEERRQLRTQQAKSICEKVLESEGKDEWIWAILGLDMNDIPGTFSIQI